MNAADPFLAYTDHDILDSADIGGHLDPGELADLVVSVTNFGPDAQSAVATLTTDSPFVDVLTGFSALGAIETGETVDNSSNPFVVEASDLVPQGYVAEFTLTVEDASGETVSTFPLAVGPLDYFVWDASPDKSGGQGMHAALQTAGYTGGWTAELPLGELDRYATLWITVGVYSSNTIIGSNSTEAQAILDYLNAGGNVYLEGADVWAYDPSVGGHNFGPTFGISGQSDGTGDLGQVQGLPGTITEGVAMYYGGENAYIDHLGAVGAGFPILKNTSPFYYCGVANDTGVYRTVGTSFEFAWLGDETPPSTKADLARMIMEFFLPVDPAGVPGEVANGSHVMFRGESPLTRAGQCQLVLTREAAVRVDLLDVTGRRVHTLISGTHRAGEYPLTLCQEQIGTGVFFLRAVSESATVNRRVLITQ